MASEENRFCYYLAPTGDRSHLMKNENSETCLCGLKVIRLLSEGGKDVGKISRGKPVEPLCTRCDQRRLNLMREYYGRKK